MSPGKQFLTAFKIIVQTQSDSFGEVILWRGPSQFCLATKGTGEWKKKRQANGGGKRLIFDPLSLACVTPHRCDQNRAEMTSLISNHNGHLQGICPSFAHYALALASDPPGAHSRFHSAVPNKRPRQGGSLSLGQGLAQDALSDTDSIHKYSGIRPIV